VRAELYGDSAEAGDGAYLWLLNSRAEQIYVRRIDNTPEVWAALTGEEECKL